LAERGGRHKDAAVEPFVLSGGSLQERSRPKVIFGGIHLRALGDAAEHIVRTVAQAAIAHLDQDSVAGPQHVVGLQLRDPVVAENLPVGATRQDRALKHGALESTFKDVDDSAQPAWRRADLDRRGKDALDIA